MKKIYVFLFLLIIPLGITPNAFALTIGDDSNGGECNTVGSWNPATRTCTLSMDVNEGIVMDANLIILDGNNFSLIGPGGDFENYGILIEVMFGITIKNIVVDDFFVGIQLRDSFDISIIDNTVQNIKFEGIDLESFSVDNLISGNTVINNGGSGINLQSSDNVVQDNFVHSNKVGISDFASGNMLINNDVQFNTDHGFSVTSSDLIIQDNIISENLSTGIFNLGGDNITITNNLISNNNKGVLLLASNSNVFQNDIIGNSDLGLENGHSTNKIYNNSFLNNAINAKDTSASASFNLAVPVGGNYWDDFSHICTNANNDNYCDDPYPFSGGSINVHDNLVWVVLEGWLTEFSGIANIIVDATSESGAIVNYSVTATHDGDPIPVTCDPESGSIFPIGTTEVVCTASNGVVATFSVMVNPLGGTGCIPLQNGDWLIKESCILVDDSIISGNVSVQGNSLLTIATGTTLSLAGGNNITIQSGSGVLIKSGGTFRINPFPDSASVSIPQGTSVSGCEETNECFIPFEVTILVGGEVTWSNDDTAAHTVTAGNSVDGPSGEFDSSLVSAGQTFSHTFESAGEFPYFCLVHPWMNGIVNVV